MLGPTGNVLPPPVVHPDYPALAALTRADRHGPCLGVQIGLGERERLADPQTGAQQDRDQRSRTVRVVAVSSLAHDEDDFLNGWRVGRVAEPPCSAGRAPPNDQASRPASADDP